MQLAGRMSLAGWSDVDVCLTNQFPFVKQEEEGSQGGQAAQLPQAKQGSGGLAESRGPSRGRLHGELLAAPGRPGTTAASL